MSELIYSWLNDEVQLSKKITKFEPDFANGYFFGELLSKFNQQLNFKEFENKDLRESKLRNFKMLEPTFKILKVNSNSITVDEIINEKEGVAGSMLYELRMALEKVNNPADIMILHKTGKFNPITPLKRLDVGKSQFDTMESRFFDRRINEMNKAQKLVNLEKHLQPFENFKKNQAETLKRRRAEDIIKENKIKEEMRKIQLNKLQRNMAFLENWNEKGKENWEKNQKTMKERVKKDEDFRAKTQERRSVKLEAINEQNQKEIYEGILNFENNLKKLGIESTNPEGGERKAISLDKSHTMFSASATMLRIKEKKMISDFLRKERDKRRRKMIVDQAKAQREIEVRKRKDLLLDKLNQQSRQEKELSYEIWRAVQCREIIIDDRVLREGKYKQKREQYVLSSKHKEEEMLFVLKDEFTMDIEAKKIRLTELQIQEKKEFRKNNYNLMKKVMDDIFEVSELLYSHQQDKDSFEFSQNFFAEIVKLFTNSKALVPYRTIRNPTGIKALTMEYEEKEKESIDFLSVQELTDYIEGKGNWIPMHKGDSPENPELDDKYMPKNPLNNYYLGNLVKFLIMRSYKAENKNENEKNQANTNYLPIKLALLGYDFSGKKTLISYLKQKYGIEPIYLDILVQEALEKANEQINRSENPDEIPKLEEIPRTRQDKEYIDLALEIRKTLISGKKIQDIHYVKLIISRLNKLFPAMTYDSFVDNFRDLPETTEQMIISEKKNSILGAVPLTKEELFLKNLMTHHHKFTKGWVLYDFPHTYNQAKLLEEHLTGFLPKDQRNLETYEKKLETASLLAKANPVTIVARKMKTSGIDCCFLLKSTKEECLRRALGRRYDSLTKVSYHLDDSAPPTDNAPLIERLESKREIKENELVLVDKLNAFDANYHDLKEWMQVFGFEEISMNNWQEIEGQKDPVLNFEIVSHIIEKIMELKENMVQNELNKRKMQVELEIKAKEEQKLKEEKEKEMSLIDIEEIKQDMQKIQIKSALGPDSLKPEHIKLLMSLWEMIENYYLTQTKEVFQNMRQQREFISMRLAEIQRHFLDILQRKDKKFAYILDYQEKYNSFIDANPDMIEDNQTKEEMHQRVEDLHDLLFDIIESKRDECCEERKSIISSGFIESEMDFFLNNVQILLQAELLRGFRVIQLLSDYYALLDRKDLPEIPEFYQNQFNTNYETIPLENPEDLNNPLPRLEKMINDCVRIFNGEDEEVVVGGAQGKNKGKPAANVSPKKEDPRKKKPAGKEVVEEEKKEETKWELELKKALNVEKAIFRYRVMVIKNTAASKLNEMRLQAKLLAGKLEDWIFYTHKIENDAVAETTKMLRGFIEREEKIQKEIQLDYVQVIVSYKTLNFLTPAPIILPAKEERLNNRFTISQLYQIIEELKGLSSIVLLLESKALLQYLFRKTVNGVSENMLPQTWISHGLKHYQNLINNLDEESTGTINGKAFCTYLCLLNSEIMTSDAKDAYNEALRVYEKNTINLNEFVHVSAWFDEFEKGKTEENAHYFNREKHLKTLIFSIVCDENGFLNIDSLIKILDLSEYQDFMKESKTYYDFLFKEKQ